MAQFFGDLDVQLVHARTQTPVTSIAEALSQKKYFLMPFCGKDTPGSRVFIPNVRHFYEKFSHDKNFEVIFVSLDSSKDKMASYMETAHGDWLALSHESAQRVGPILMKKYGIEYPPAMLVFERTEDGRRLLLTHVGRDMLVHDEEGEMFPWANGDSYMRRYKRGLLINILICIVIAIVIGYFLSRATF